MAKNAKPNKTTTQETTDNADWERQWAEIQEKASEMPTILPRLRFSLNPSAKDGTVGSARVRFDEARPHIVRYMDEEEGEEKTFPVINVTDLSDGQRKTLAVSARSLLNSVGKISKDHGGNLEGVRVEIRVEGYTHPKFGPNTPGYRVSEFQDLEEQQEA